MMYNIFCRFRRLASALRHLCGRAPMHRQTSMYKSLRPGGARAERTRVRPAGVEFERFQCRLRNSNRICNIYMQPSFMFLQIGLCLTAVVWRHRQGAHAWPGGNVRIERVQ